VVANFLSGIEDHNLESVKRGAMTSRETAEHLSQISIIVFRAKFSAFLGNHSLWRGPDDEYLFIL
jgi:hypothetical protein